MSAVQGKEFVIPVETQAGTLADITTALAKAEVNIRGFICDGHGDFSVLRLVTDKPDATEEMLRAARHVFRTHDVLTVHVPNRPGELARIAQRLAASGVNVNAAYATSANDGRTELTFSVDDLRSAVKILGTG